MRIAIEVQGVKGAATVIYAITEWYDMNPLARVRSLHEAARDVLDGQKFDIVRQQRIEGRDHA